jgi:effector-binding domain-containing protein
MNDQLTNDETRIVELPPQATVAARVREPLEGIDIGAMFGLHMSNVADRIADLGGTPAGPAYARYHEWGPDQVDAEFGIPVMAPVTSLRPLAECQPGEVGMSELPGGAAAITVHHGDYRRMGEAYERLGARIKAEGRAPGAGAWESYINDPTEVDEADLLTELVWPLA